jgi:hypothetical protein
MSSSGTKAVKSQSAKKLVKKQPKPVEVLPEPVVKKTKKVSKKTEVVEEPLVKSEPVKSSKTKEDTLLSKKEETKGEPEKEVKNEEDPEKRIKKAKKINDKPTLSDNCGLNLSVAKVKNIISNLCINKEQFAVLKELKEARVLDEEKLDNDGNPIKEDSPSKKKRTFTFSLKEVSAETLAFLEKAHQNNLELLKESFTKTAIKKMNEETKKDYVTQRKAAVVAHQSEQKSGYLFQSHEFNTADFNVKWNKNFYKGMDFPDWKSMENMDLYDYCVTVVNKMKVRFNAESKIFVTAFVEHIVQQMVVNGTVNCVGDNKKIIQLTHALDTSSEGFEKRFNLFPLILNLESYHKVCHEEVSSEEVEPEIKTDESQDGDQIDRKYQFKYYVTELCRTVKMKLAREDSPEDISKSNYYHVSVSRVFKNFCSNIIVDLIRMFGEVLKVEVSSRNVKTVNYTIIQTLVQVSHIMYGLGAHLDETVQFIQQTYTSYQRFIEDRKTKRVKSDTTAEKDDEDEL